jgi:putative ATP-dependent endonuclease of the OLD family
MAPLQPGIDRGAAALMGVKLTKVEIKNYRSIFEAPGASTCCLQLAEGMNAVVGPNNCGKSNILKALALALEEGEEGTFVRERDEPTQLLWARPTITLDFVVERAAGPERTLLQRLEEYEQSALQGEAKATLASKSRFRLRVQYSNAGRDEFFMTAAGGRRGTQELNTRATEQFRKVVRFVLVRSGESVEDFLAGRFNDLLHTVIQENLRSQVAAAEVKRERYRNDVSTSVFGPVAQLVAREIGQMIPEIQEVQFEPRVLGIEETLSSAGITLADSAKTGLAEKGTGVRGSLLLAMLRYIAEHSRRSVIFAVEEPEAFLHPGAQEEVRDDLERLADRDDVTLIVTTHSPFVISRDPHARLISVAKEPDGRTRILGTTPGDADARDALGGLFKDDVMPDYLERAAAVPEHVRAVVVVEGYTDAHYLRLAAERCGAKSAPAKGIEVVPADGAKSAAVQAVLFREARRCPVLVLLDYEEGTKGYLTMLKETFGFRGDEVFTYREWGPAPKSEAAVEAEGLFPPAFLERFVRKFGEDSVVAEKTKVKSGWRYGFNQSGKGRFIDFVSDRATRKDLQQFAAVWQSIDGRVSKAEERAAKRAAAAAAAAA